MDNKLFRKADLIIITAVALAAISFLIWNRTSHSENLIAEISVNGEIIERIDLNSLNEEIVIHPDTDYNVEIIAENGTVYFSKSDCPDKICISRGKLYRKGDTAVCLPAKTIVTITGSELDALTY